MTRIEDTINIKAKPVFAAMTMFPSLGRKIIIPVFALAFVISACDSSDAIEPSETTDDSASFDIAQSVSFIASDLDLSSDEISELQGAFDEQADRAHEPGFLWNVAARLQANLTDEQKERLFERIENRPFPRGHFDGDRFDGDRSGSDRFGPSDSDRPDFMHFKGGLLSGLERFFDLSETQLEEMKALREEFGSSLRAITESVKDGTLDRTEARSQMKTLAEGLKESIDALLTDEQKAAIEDKKAEFEARRDNNAEAAKEVMISVLGLDPDQLSLLEALRATVDEDRLEFRELIENGATVDEIRELAEAARAAHNEALAGILDKTQYEIFVIHGALASRMKMRRGQDRLRQDRMHDRFG